MGGVRWLTTSSSEISRAREVLKALKPGGVIDELGFLILNDAFSERLYPAVTTPMTRARYFFLIPAIYRHLEQSGLAKGRDADRVARDLQFALLERVRSEKGAIGKESGREIVRPPADIYWGALADLGLAARRISMASYHRQLSKGEYRAETIRDDDAAVHPGEVISLWDSNLRVEQLLDQGGFAEGTTLRLRRSEAKVLGDRYSDLQPEGHRTLIPLMVALAERGGLSSVEGFEYPWDVPGVAGSLARTLGHARRLSLFGRGTTLQYHCMILEKKGLAIDAAGQAFVAWWEGSRQDLADWDLDDFFELISSWGANRRAVEDRRFFSSWIARCVEATSGEAALGDRISRGVISVREDAVRPGKQRLRVKYQLDSWQPMRTYRPEELYQFGYRHSVGRQFATDIAEGLQKGAT